MEVLKSKTGIDSYGRNTTVKLIRVPAGEANTPSPVVRPYDIYKVSSSYGSSWVSYGRIYNDADEAALLFDRITLK